MKECIRRKNVCIAISFGDENRCHLVKKGVYQQRRFNDWVSIYLENQAPIKAEYKNSTYTAKRFKNFTYLYSLFDFVCFLNKHIFYIKNLLLLKRLFSERLVYLSLFLIRFPSQLTKCQLRQSIYFLICLDREKTYWMKI